MSLFHHQKTISFLKQITVTMTVVFGFCMLHACFQESGETLMGRKSRVQVELSTFHFDIENMGVLSRGTLSDAVTHLSFAVFDADGSLVDTAIHQVFTDDDFGTVKVELYPGEYQLVAVAHNGSDHATVTSATSVTLPGITFTDTFAQVQELTVESGKDCSLDMPLPRATSAFVLRLTDTPPAQAKEIQVVVNTTGVDPVSLKIDPGIRLAANTWKQTHTFPIEDIISDVPIYFIGMLEESVVTVKATAFDAEGKEIISHTINSVPLSTNHQTIATGTFFQSSGSGTFTIDTTWGTNNEIEY